MGREAAILKCCFPHPTPRSEAQSETAAGAFGQGASGKGYATKYPAFALAENPAGAVVSQGQLVLGAGQRKTVPTLKHLQAETGWGRRRGLTGLMRQFVTSKQGEQDGLWDREGQSSGAKIPLHPGIP